MTRSIFASVGHLGVNDSADARIVQEMLNLIPAAQAGPAPALVVDGFAETKTIGAIRTFQKRHFGWDDGRVDPDNKTIAKLNALIDEIYTPPKPLVPFRPIPDPRLPHVPRSPVSGLPGFVAASIHDGFDDDILPPWLMVPQGRFQTVRLANGSGLTVSSLSPEVVQVLDHSPPESGIVRLFGQSRGDALIVAESGTNGFAAQLEVSVRPLMTIKTAFFYVEDMPRLKAFTHRTDRNPGDEERLVKAANAILLPRANIRLEVTTAQRLPIARNLGWIIRTSGDHVREPIRNDEWDVVVSNRDYYADFNVFFVWRFEMDRTPLKNDSWAATNRCQKSCIMEDDPPLPEGLILAHETGHLLGVQFHSDDPEYLMTMGTNGVEIPREHFFIMHGDKKQPGSGDCEKS